MPRRVSLPAADDLFRPTADPAAETDGVPEVRTSRARSAARVPTNGASPAPAPARAAKRAATRAPAKKSSGRVKHDEKMTVYVTADELIDLEHARLSLRRDLGLAVDRGRVVREAVAWALEDLAAHGEDSMLASRLRAE